MDAAIGRLHEIGPARLTQPGAEPVTVAELEAARQALAGPAQAIEAAAEDLERVADRRACHRAAPGGTSGRTQAMHLETYAAGLAWQPWRSGRQRAQRARRSLTMPATRLRVPPAPAADAEAIEAAATALNAMVDATERLDAAVRATALGRADALLGAGHGLDRDRATAVMDLADRLFGDYPPGLTDAQRFDRLASQAGVRHREDADAEPGLAITRDSALVGLLGLATEVFDDGARRTWHDLIDLRRLADIIRTAPVAAGGVRGRDVTAG